jgi:hypothetical protein
MFNQLLAMFDGWATPGIIILFVLGVLLFGRKLPDAVRFFGKGLTGELDSEEQSNFFASLLLLAAIMLVFAFCVTAITSR